MFRLTLGSTCVEGHWFERSKVMMVLDHELDLV